MTNNCLNHFLRSKEQSLLNEWTNDIKKNNDEPINDFIIEISEKLYKILLYVTNEKNHKIEEEINKLASLVAEKQVHMNKNIGDCILKVSHGKTIIFHHLNKLPFGISELQEAIMKVNDVFDQFLYQTVSHYTNVKDQIIEEKTNYIDTTHKDRLTILGQMTSSFIHEFRNPLTSVQGFVQLLQGEYPDMKYLNIISSEIDQLNFQISQFLLLSKKELIGKKKTVFSLNDMLEEVLVFLYPSILDGKVTVTKNMKDGLQLNGYADELRQVFINIIFNAIDVLNHDRENPEIIIHAGLNSDHHIFISITNNGPMIPKNMLNTIFEPFVTTKKLGTGLGLFICKEIIEKHKGSLTCTSEPNTTNFMITLPPAV